MVNKENDSLNDEDVVVIEERDKHTYLYIGIAAVLGLALGGLTGAVLTKTKWESAYQQLEVKVAQLEKAKSQVIVKVEEKTANMDAEINAEVESRLNKELEMLRSANSEEVSKSRAMVSELEKVNLDLEAQISQLKEQTLKLEKDQADLEKQNEMQSVVIERARGLFQKELLIKQDLDKLRQEREELIPKLERFKKECDAYLEGKSWDASSKACDRYDEANSNLSHIDQMIEVHKLDLREIEQISDSIGL